MIRYRTGDVTSLDPCALPLRPHHRADRAHQGAQRRHAGHQGGERLSVPARGGAADGRRPGSALPARRGPDATTFPTLAVQVEPARARWCASGAASTPRPPELRRAVGPRRRAAARPPRPQPGDRDRGHRRPSPAARARRCGSWSGGQRDESWQGDDDEEPELLARIERGERIESPEEMTEAYRRESRPPDDHAGRLRAGRRLRLRAVDHEGARRRGKARGRPDREGRAAPRRRDVRAPRRPGRRRGRPRASRTTRPSPCASTPTPTSAPRASPPTSASTSSTTRSTPGPTSSSSTSAWTAAPGTSSRTCASAPTGPGRAPSRASSRRRSSTSATASSG